jgi:hypothetical protein
MLITDIFHWAEYAENPELKKQLIHRVNPDGMYELYDPINNRILIASNQPLVSYLED